MQRPIVVTILPIGVLYRLKTDRFSTLQVFGIYINTLVRHDIYLFVLTRRHYVCIFVLYRVHH